MHDKVEDYRRITISPLISKIFEQCLMYCTQDFFQSSDRQFGFKKGLGCNHAVFSLRKVVDNFTKNNSTINICTLDISKAFDRLDHHILLCKLMNRNLPRFFIVLLHNWCPKCIQLLNGRMFFLVF